MIPNITKQEFRDTIEQYILGWQNKAEHKTDLAELAFIVLTLCRSMYAYSSYVNVSKPIAAKWAINEYPQFAELIKNAVLLSRSTSPKDTQKLLDRNEVLRFVNYICTEVQKFDNNY
jgi:hypothetical protein